VLVRDGRGADMHDVNAVEQRVERAECPDASLLGVLVARFLRAAIDADYLGLGGVEFGDGFIVEVCGEACADDAGSNGFLCHGKVSLSLVFFKIASDFAALIVSVAAGLLLREWRVDSREFRGSRQGHGCAIGGWC